MKENEYAPLEGCACAVCNWVREQFLRQIALDEDLAANYARYEAGELVSSGERD